MKKGLLRQIGLLCQECFTIYLIIFFIILIIQGFLNWKFAFSGLNILIPIIVITGAGMIFFKAKKNSHHSKRASTNFLNFLTKY